MDNSTTSRTPFSSTIDGKPVFEIVEKDHRIAQDELDVIADKVRNAAYEIIDRKKATYYGIGMSTARIVKAILNNEQAVLPVSAYLTGEYDEKDIFTGLPPTVVCDHAATSESPCSPKI
ncbi:TPA: hypothetical protein LLC35_000125 [Enterococcus faecium]|nr:hypothetical protein [Enterococcus faecium]